MAQNAPLMIENKVYTSFIVEDIMFHTLLLLLLVLVLFLLSLITYVIKIGAKFNCICSPESHRVASSGGRCWNECFIYMDVVFLIFLFHFFSCCSCYSSVNRWQRKRNIIQISNVCSTDY